MEDDARIALEEARKTIQEQQEFIRQLTEPPIPYATVVATAKGSGESGSFVVIATKDGLLEVLPPEKLEVKAGDTVRLAESMQISGIVPLDASGDIASVIRVSGGLAEVESMGSVRMVYEGCSTPEIGDRVLLDGSASVITANLGPEESRYRFESNANVSWDDIGGLAEAKAHMIEAIEYPQRYAKLYEHYQKRPVKGVLLYGPPGCGKTMLGKAAATSIAGGQGAGFFYVKGPEILDRFVGVAEATIRQLFANARRYKEEHGFPAVLFIDEADAILGRRGSGISSDMERTIVPMFLTEMDGLEDSGALVILATNRADTLDPAATRDGRIDRKVKVDRPDRDAAKSIFRLHLDAVPFSNGHSVDEIATAAADDLYRADRTLYRIEMPGKERRDLPFSGIVSGGMITNIVDHASSAALRRDIEKNRGGGLRRSDILDAIETVYREALPLDHSDELAEHLGGDRKKVVSIHKGA